MNLLSSRKAETVQESVTISHRGNRCEIGSGRGFYGIWLIGDSPGAHRQLAEWWPPSPEGWHQAWSRFTTIEAADAIVPVGATKPPSGISDAAPTTAAPAAPAAGGVRLLAAGLLAIGVVVGIVGLFPSYLGGASLAAQSAQLVPHLIYLAGWAASAALLLWRGTGWRPAVGALVAVGISAVTFGLFFADLGNVFAGGSQLFGAGLLLNLIGWLVCACGSVIAILFVRSGSPRKLAGRETVLAFILTVAAAAGAAIAFAPSWDSFTLRTPTGLDTTITQGNAFAYPWPIMVGDVAVMALIVAVVAIAALWQPVKLAAALIAGASIPLLAQAISAVVQLQTPASPQQLGITPGSASQAGLTISSGLTPAFWIYCAFVLALVLIGARMLTSPAPEPPAPASAIPVTAGAGAAFEPDRTP